MQTALVGVASLLAAAYSPTHSATSLWPQQRRQSSSLRMVARSSLQSNRRSVATSLLAMVSVVAARRSSAAEAGVYPKVVIQTTEGAMEFDLWNDVAPKHVENFLTLAKQGFFDGQAFHRIIPGFVIQGGDPNSKIGYGPGGTLEGADKSKVRMWGRGGPGYNVKAEFNERPHEFGVLSMARANDPDSAGSQFFVCLGRLPSLDNKYTVFGKLTKGEDVLRRLGSAKTVAGDIPERRQGIERVDRI